MKTTHLGGERNGENSKASSLGVVELASLLTWTKQLVTVIVAALVVAAIVRYVVGKFETFTMAAAVGIMADACDAAKLAMKE